MSQKAIFLDRDDTVIDDPGYIKEPEQVKLLPGAAEALIQFKRMGYLVIIITNQSAIARGYITEDKLEEIHLKLKTLLSAQGATIDGLYYCPYHPEGTVKDFSMESNLRKPNAGMLFQAADELDIDLNASWMIGDRYKDVQAGKAAGCQTILVDVPGKARELNTTGPEPDRKAVNLREAVNIIRMYEFHQKANSAKNNTAPSSPQETTDKKTHPSPIEAEEEKTAVAVETKKTTTPTMVEIKPAPVKPKTPAQSVVQKEVSKSKPVKFHTTKAVPKHNEPLPEDHTEKTHHLLHEILQRVTASTRNELYDDFSIHKLLAGMAQVLALGCLVFSLYFWLSPKIGADSVLIMIGYAIALQLLVVSLLMMHRRD